MDPITLAREDPIREALGAPAPMLAGAPAPEPACAPVAADAPEPASTPASADAVSLEERLELLERHVLQQTEHREIRIATLGFCRERRALQEVELFIQDLPEYGYDSQNPYRLILGLERAGGLARVELDEDGEVVTSQRKEGLTEDEVDDLVFEVDFETTGAGEAAYERLRPRARLADLFEEQPARADTYRELLEFCLVPRSREEVERLLEGREILALEAPGVQSLKPSVFIDRLERSGVLVWCGKWVTGEEGKAYLDERAAG